MVKARITGIEKLNKENCLISAIDFDVIHTGEDGPIYKLYMPLWRVERLAQNSGTKDINDLVGKNLLIDRNASIVALLCAEDVDRISLVGHNRVSNR